MDERFWEYVDELVAISRLVIDRPARATVPVGAVASRPLDYGYLRGTAAVDGEGVDVWRGSLAGARVTGAIATVDLLKRETELKLLVGCTREEAKAALAAHNFGRQAGVLVLRA